MRLLVIFLLALTAVLSIGGATTASTLVTEDGYSYSDGYWWYNDAAYTRKLLYSAGYWSCGLWYPGTSYYHYSFHHSRAKVSYTDSNWRTKLLELATARDKVEQEIRKGAFEQQYFMAAVKALGLEGNFRVNGYGQAAPYNGINDYAGNFNGTLQLSTAGANGNTVYGYSFNSIANLYGDQSLNQLYQQANRLAERQQSIASQATTEFGALIGAEGANRARVAEILAKGQAVQEMLRSLEGNKSESKTFSFKVERGADGNLQISKAEAPAPVDVASLEKKWQASAKQCLNCHSGAKKEGGFDVTTFPSLTVDQKMHVVSQLTTKDPAKRMPRTPDGKAGQLSPEELATWLSAAQLKTETK